MDKVKFIFILAVLAMAATGCTSSSRKMMGKFKGMWKLDKYESYDSVNHKWSDAPSRMGYMGYILYDGIGHMGVQLLPPGFKKTNNKNNDSLNNDEAKYLLSLHEASYSYFATCVIMKSNLIEHHRLSSNHPKEAGTTITRIFQFRNDTLILTAKELIGGLETRLRWVKIQ